LTSNYACEYTCHLRYSVNEFIWIFYDMINRFKSFVKIFCEKGQTQEMKRQTKSIKEWPYSLKPQIVATNEHFIENLRDFRIVNQVPL